MREFRDKTGQTWQITIDAVAVDRVRAASDGRFDLADPERLFPRTYDDDPLATVDDYRRTGFITPNGGGQPVFFHANHLAGGLQFDRCLLGERVDVDCHQEGKGLRADRVCPVEFEMTRDAADRLVAKNIRAAV